MARWGALPWIALAALGAVCGSSLLGPTWLGASDLFWTLRVPRTALAAAAGAGLAVAGVVFQSILRNPLATPDTLGVSSAAALAAAYGFLTGVRGVWPLGLGVGLPKLVAYAFCGALLGIAVVYALARWRGGRDLTGVLLAGVCLSHLSAAGVVLVTFLANQAITNEIVVWMMGSVAVVGWQPSITIAVALLPVLALLWCWRRELDLLALGELVAASRGVAVERVIWGGLIVTAALTATIVAHCGPIGFVGLIVPHAARAFVGARTGPLLAASALLGAAFLALCDGAARSLMRSELPAGVLTNIIGALFFLQLLARRRDLLALR